MQLSAALHTKVPLAAARDVDEMPRGGFGMLVAEVVGPGGGVGHRVGLNRLAEPEQGRIDRIIGEDLIDHGKGVRVEVLLGNQRDGLVAVAAPGKGAGAMENTSRENDQERLEARTIHGTPRELRFGRPILWVRPGEEKVL